MKEIPLNQGKVALVDDEIYERLKYAVWKVGKKDGKSCAFRLMWPISLTRQYLIRQRYWMHNEIMHIGNHSPFEIVHLDGCGLNNTKTNLKKIQKRRNS